LIVMPDIAVDVAVAGTHAYVADWTAGLQVVDLANSVQPTIVGSVALPGHAMSVTVSGNLAAVAASEAGVHLVDVSQPTAPVLLATYDTRGSARSAWLADSILHVADWGGGLIALDVSDPSAPVVLGGRLTPGLASEVVVAGNCAFVTDGPGGLEIVQAQCTSAAMTVADRSAGGRLALGCRPNPAWSGTTIAYRAPAARGGLTVRVCDLSGRVVRTLLAGRGTDDEGPTVAWDGRDDGGRRLSPGIYWVELRAGGERRSARLVLMR
jgi:hypothetical protein